MRANFLLAIFGCAAALVIAEIVLRLLGISYPYFTGVDADTGFSLRPHAEGWVLDEGRAYVKINSHGFRDRERKLTKPSGTLRIAVLGDSFIEARQVEFEETLPSILEQKLQECVPVAEIHESPLRVDVLNFGVSGFSTIQELQLLSRVLAFDPDLIIVAFTPGNDVRGNSKELSKGTQQPYLAEAEDGSYVIDTSFRDTDFYRSQSSPVSRAILTVINRSRVAQVVNRGRILLRRNKTVAEIHESPLQGEPGLDDEIYRESSDVRWQEAWHMTEEAFRRIRDTVETNGAKLVITVISTAIQVDPDAAKRAKAAKDLGVRDLLSPIRHIEGIGRTLHVPVFSLVEPLERYAKEKNVYLHGFGTGLGSGHWNAEGHRAAAEALAEFLCTKQQPAT